MSACIRNILVLSILSIVLMSCSATYEDGRKKIIEGEEFRYEKVAMLEEDVSSYQEIIDLLGEPLEETRDEDRTKMRYFQKLRSDSHRRGWIWEEHYVSLYEYEVTLRLDSGVLERTYIVSQARHYEPLDVK